MADSVIDLNTTKIQDIELNVKYCITNELREAQVRDALKRNLPTIQPHKERDESVAVVCYGPSLRETWEDVKKFDVIMSMSGATNFLIERGIVPTWHIACDPREEQTAFVKNPHKDVEYLISSNCHPKVFDALEGYNVKIWHLFGNELMQDLPAYYPRGHWILTGGGNIGLRGMVLARFFGFRDIHIFGMDCSFRATAHAGDHPNEAKKRLKVRCGKRIYETNGAFLEYAKQFFHEAEKLPDCHLTLHGVGLLQNMAFNQLEKPLEPKDVVKVRGGGEVIAFCSPDVLIPKSDPAQTPIGVGPTVVKLKESTGANSVLLYGPGMRDVANTLPFPVWTFDEGDRPPRSAELVIFSGVPLKEEVVMDLKRVTRKVGYFVLKSEEEVAWLRTALDIAKVLKSNDYHVIAGPRRKGIPIATKAA